MEKETQKQILCVDFDGVIHAYTSGWQGAGVVADLPVAGAFAWLIDMLDEGFVVAIYSSRSKEREGILTMRAWFSEHGFPVEYLERLTFPDQKPAATLTIDDRAFRFEGDFPSATWIRRFRPWNK